MRRKKLNNTEAAAAEVRQELSAAKEEERKDGQEKASQTGRRKRSSSRRQGEKRKQPNNETGEAKAVQGRSESEKSVKKANAGAQKTPEAAKGAQKANAGTQKAPKAAKGAKKANAGTQKAPEAAKKANTGAQKTQSKKKRQSAAPAANADNLSLALSAAAAGEPLPYRAGIKKRRGPHKNGLKIIPLGGLEQIGMNITAYEYEDTIIVVDCGLAFPAEDMLGIDLVIPDVTYLKDNIEKVKGFLITHAHEDHIGSLPYILPEVNVPIYATKLTMGIIENKLKEHNLMKTTKRRIIKLGQTVNLGCFRVEFIRTNHSIVDSAAFAIYTPVGTVVHTGDFKIDYTPVFGESFDLQRLGEIGRKGVLALLADSTNVERPGYTMSERTVGKTFDNIFSENTNHRILVATFASNVDRVQQIINSACKFGRKVIIDGRSMVNVITTAQELGYINIPDGVLIDIERIRHYPPEKIVLITTGSQGEEMAALSRIAASVHKKVSIMPGDTVILSSNPIPGNEKQVSRVINELSRQGAKVIYQDTHVSGHACQEEIKLIYALTKPKYAIPLHGEYRHLVRHAELAHSVGVEKDNIFILSSGDVLELDEEQAGIVDHVMAQGILVDGLGVGDVGNVVLKDRQHLSESGILVVVVTVQKGTNEILAGPEVISRGFVYVKEAEDLFEEAQAVVAETLDQYLRRKVIDWGKAKNLIKDALSDFVWKKTKRSPMILPIIEEVDV